MKFLVGLVGRNEDVFFVNQYHELFPHAPTNILTESIPNIY